MKRIYKIAWTELQMLFYSPVAWLILIIFTFQASMVFTQAIETLIVNEALGYRITGATSQIFYGWGALFSGVKENLYFYIPLLTMGLMSREFSSGSIKLLYSSPITNRQIILGKFLAMMIYGLLLIGILLIYVIYTIFAVKSPDTYAMFSGLLGLYLLICAYVAIGLFMSSLTSYQVVAAMCTLAMLAVLNFIGGIWQDVAFVRDITYWLSISGRAEEFIRGLICSEDVLYFVIVVTLFLSLTIIHLQAQRQKSSQMITWGKYVGVFLACSLLGYLTSRPVFMTFYDTTQTKSLTLTPNSQEVVKKLTGGLTITTYTNLLDPQFRLALPKSVNFDLRRFKQYTRFKPQIKMKYVYYYDQTYNPALEQRYPGLNDKERAQKVAETMDLDFRIFLTPEEIKKKIDLSSEGNRFVRILERETGEKSILRIFDDPIVTPMESEITAAFKRLVMVCPKVAFLHGHDERDNRLDRERDYSRFAQEKSYRYSLINQGFDVTDVTLDQEIPSDVSILVVADLKSALTPGEMQNFNQYIERGGNLFILGEPRRQEFMNPLTEPLGVTFMPGNLVQPTGNYPTNLIQARPTKEATKLSYHYDYLYNYSVVITMLGCTGLEYTTDKGFSVQPLFVSDSTGCWNEMKTIHFVEDSIQMTPASGDVEQSYTTAIALTRQINGKEQKIVITGDADCISNGETAISRKNIPAANHLLITGTFYWLSDSELPIDDRRPALPDNGLNVDKNGIFTSRIILMGLLPVIFILLYVFIWIRRRGR